MLCLLIMPNGTEAIDYCSSTSNSSTETIIHSITHLRGVTFWGAQTYMYINLIHFFACALVVIIYCVLPNENKNLYNRLVLRHNVCLLMLGGILTLLGYNHMTGCIFGDAITRLLWLSLQYFTNATVFWLNVVCFDMTLGITRLNWIFNIVNREDENQKLVVYGVLVWIGTLIPTLIAAVCEFVPQVPNGFPLKANYTEASKGENRVVNMYFFLIPALTLFCNNLLFVLTTYSIIKVQRSTKLAIKNQESLLRKKYFLFLRLYLFMGAPWFFGTALAYIYNNLVVLKICRMSQPVLWLVMLASRKKIQQQLIGKFKRKKNSDNNTLGSDDAVIFQSRDNLVTS